MVRAIKSVSVERGRDPADFVMMAFGGAGPIHAAGVARTLGIRKVARPAGAGRVQRAGPVARRSRAPCGAHGADGHRRRRRPGTGCRRRWREMRNDLRNRVREEGFDPATAEFEQFADLRYRGQSSELTVPMPDGVLDVPALRARRGAFRAGIRAHVWPSRRYQGVRAGDGATGDAGAARGRAWHRLGAGTQRRRTRGARSTSARSTAQLDTAVLSRRSLRSQRRAQGPLLIQEYDTTIVVPPGCDASVDDHGNVVIGIER